VPLRPRCRSVEMRLRNRRLTGEQAVRTAHRVPTPPRSVGRQRICRRSPPGRHLRPSRRAAARLPPSRSAGDQLLPDVMNHEVVVVGWQLVCRRRSPGRHSPRGRRRARAQRLTRGDGRRQAPALRPRRRGRLVPGRWVVGRQLVCRRPDRQETSSCPTTRIARSSSSGGSSSAAVHRPAAICCQAGDKLLPDEPTRPARRTKNPGWMPLESWRRVLLPAEQRLLTPSNVVGAGTGSLPPLVQHPDTEGRRASVAEPDP
jgi:hypothetical protein